MREKEERLWCRVLFFSELYVQAVQQLSDVQPNILSQPMVLQAALRRHLELGQTEPHELSQVKQLAAPTVGSQAAMMNPGGF